MSAGVALLGIVERRSAGEAPRRATKRRDRGRTRRREVRFIFAPSEADTRVPAGERARGERTSEGFLPPFFLFLGAILSGRWKCAGAATGAREWRRRNRKSSLHHAAFFRAPADSRREPPKGGSGIANRHRADQTAFMCSQSFESENARNRMKVSLQVLLNHLKKNQNAKKASASSRYVTHVSRDDVLRRVEGVLSGLRLRGEAPAEGRAAPRVATAGPAWRVRRPRPSRRAAGVQVRAATRAIRRGDARCAVRG